MRFSAAITPSPSLIPPAMDELMRRLIGDGNRPAADADTAPAPLAAELPDDLDQRVRQIGEW